jgi:Stress responsive A/B Barrel Domain
MRTWCFLHLTIPQARAKLTAACHEYLSGHDGVLYFSVGTIADALHREVNVRDFDVALHVIFENLAAHDRYQVHPRHLLFIEENRSTWKQVRVFDSTLR